MIPERKDFIAGSGVMFQTEAAQFIRANSANGKGCAGAFLCEVCFYILQCFEQYYWNHNLSKLYI